MTCWQIKQSTSSLAAGPLRASVELMDPTQGMHRLSWQESSLPGQILGVAVGQRTSQPTQPVTARTDHFVRGDDLVANFLECDRQPFTLQIYWRLASYATDAVVIDAIVSLQTSLLECYPQALLTTALKAEQILVVSETLMPPRPIEAPLTSDEPAAVLIRSSGTLPSYCEMTHQGDLGHWRVSQGEQVILERELGGEFQEKGVIRRLRVRGAFLSREHDVEITQQLLAEFSDSPPPLTA